MDRPAEKVPDLSAIPSHLRTLVDPQVLAILFSEPPRKVDKLIDICGQSSKTRSAEDVDRQLAEERDSW